MALRPTHPPTEMSISDISAGDKGGRYVMLEPLPQSRVDCLVILEASTPVSRPVQACNGIALTSYFLLDIASIRDSLMRQLLKKDPDL